MELNKNVRLKPCPFCGSNKLKLDKNTKHGRTTFSVRCNKCHARGGTYGIDRPDPYDRNRHEINEAISQALYLWNHRSFMIGFDSNRPQCCKDHDKWFATCDTCEFGTDK